MQRFGCPVLFVFRGLAALGLHDERNQRRLADAGVARKSVHDIDDMLASTPPGADGLTSLPFLNGERTPDLPNARGSIHGLSATNFTPAH